jgi:hypothetical protein
MKTINYIQCFSAMFIVVVFALWIEGKPLKTAFLTVLIPTIALTIMTGIIIWIKPAQKS